MNKKARYTKDPAKFISETAAWRLANYDKMRDTNYRRLYGLTLAQYNKMLELQKGVCAICKKLPVTKRLNVDHEHAQKKIPGSGGRVRGLACFRCNKFVIGRWRAEHASWLRTAADYLESTFDGRKLKI